MIFFVKTVYPVMPGGNRRLCFVSAVLSTYGPLLPPSIKGLTAFSNELFSHKKKLHRGGLTEPKIRLFRRDHSFSMYVKFISYPLIHMCVSGGKNC